MPSTSQSVEDPCVIGIETSGRTASIAVLRGALQDVRHLDETGRRHARTLVPELKELLESHEIEVGDCSAIAVSIGPGSFTGLRVGVACAKTFAWSVGCAIIGVPTFHGIAEQVTEVVPEAWIAMNAEREQLFVARAGRTAEDVEIGSLKIVDAEQWIEERTADDVVAGPLPTGIRSKLEGRVRLLDESVGRLSAETVAKIGLRRFKTGLVDDAYQLVPEYGRLSAAEEKELAGKELTRKELASQAND